MTDEHISEEKVISMLQEIESLADHLATMLETRTDDILSVCETLREALDTTDNDVVTVLGALMQLQLQACQMLAEANYPSDAQNGFVLHADALATILAKTAESGKKHISSELRGQVQ